MSRAADSKDTPSAPPPPQRRRVRRLLLAIALPVLLLFVAIWWLGPRITPLPPALVTPPAPPAMMTDRHGQPLRHALDAASATRRSGAGDPIPATLADCVIAAEDRRFYQHDGMDALAMARAVAQRLLPGQPVSGASTITQQLVKLRLHRDEPRTLGRKLVEIWLARALECRWEKPVILDAYLEEADFGDLNRGVRQAAADFFGKPMDDLSLGECAALAGLPQAPSRLNPRRHPDRLLARRAVVLDRLTKTGRRDAASIAAARAEPLAIRPPGAAFLAPHFATMVAASGARPPVRTTLDYPLQQFALGRLRHHVSRLRTRNVNQAAAVILDNATGGILALVGSLDFVAPAGQVNHATVARSPGSTLKPFTYLLAFENRRGPWSLLADIPTAFPSPTGPYRPENYDKEFRGPVTARAALANSLNVPAVRLLDDCGGAPALADILRRCGFPPLPRPAATYGLGLTLGNAEVTLLDLANAYATLARGGRAMPVRIVMETAPPPAASPVVSPAAAWLVADILRDNNARSGTFSLASPLRLPFPVAAKTGTSTDFRDNWTAGFTPDFTVAIWVGNSDNSPMQHVSGVDGAAPVFHDIMRHLHRDKQPVWPAAPPGVVDVRIDPLTGRRVPAGHPRATREWSLADALPPRLAPDDVAPGGRVRLGLEFTPWLLSAANRQPQLFAMPAAAPPATVFRILFPTPGTVAVLDPSLPGRGSRLTLETDLDGQLDIQWSSPTLAIARSPAGRPQVILRPGRHQLTATHPTTGQSQETWLDVKER